METLPDPWDDRVVKSLEPPPQRPLSDDMFYDSKGLPNYSVIKKHLAKEGKIQKDHFMKLIIDTTELLKKEENMVKVAEPVWIVGDIHGQYYDFVHLLDKAGSPKKINYIFLGDYVDRGIFSVEWVILLFSLKVAHSEAVTLLRGNHEWRNMTDHFTFREETINKFDEEVYKTIMEAFDSMPLAAVVNDRYLAIHGGLSPDLKKLSQISKIDRFKEPPVKGLFCDLLWADPMNDDEANESDFHENKERECSYLFGKKPTKKLLDNHNLMSIVRAHQVQIDGYKMHRWDGESSFPYVITLFSAPNYWDYYSNKAAVLILKDGGISIKQYDQSEHPYFLPDQLDVFSWSLPFLAEKVISLMAYILKQTTEDIDEEGENTAVNEVTTTADKMKKFGKIKTKIKTMARMQKMFATLKEESETLLKIKGMAPDGKIPRGLLLDGRPAIRDSFREFSNAAKLDKPNEKMPQFK